jgi:integrase
MGIEYIDRHKAKLIVNIGTGANRRRRTKLIEYKNKRDAQRQFLEFESLVRITEPQDALVSQVIASYIAFKESNGAEATTIRGYKACEKRLNSRFERVLARSLTTYQVEDFVAEMSKIYSPKTIRNTIGLLSASYNRAIQAGIVDKNPCQFVSLPKKEQKEIKTFSEDEIIKLIAYLRENETLDYQVGYELCLFCGLRRSEVLGLTEDAVNLEDKCVYIYSTRHRVGYEDKIQGTKTARSQRVIALPSFLADDIARLIAEHRKFGTKSLIQDGFGKELNPNTFTTHLLLIERKIGLSEVSVHGLRHTFATMLNAQGIDIARISAELGHSNIGITMNTYLHTFGNVSASSRGIADSMDKMLCESATPSATQEKEKTL